MSEFFTKHYYVIDSKDNLSGTANMVFPNHLFNHVIAFTLKEVLIPYTFYSINSTNNNLIWFKNGDVQNRDITVPPGNYTLNQLKTTIKALMDAAPGPVQTYTITDDPITYKITITQDSSTFILRGAGSINRILGFAVGPDSANAISNTAPNIYNLTYTNSIKIYSNTLTKYDTKVRTTGPGNSDLLAVINIADALFGQTIHVKYKAMHFDNHAHAENDIDIRLLDDYNQPLGGATGLNGQNFKITLQYHTKSSTDDMAYNKLDTRSYR